MNWFTRSDNKIEREDICTCGGERKGSGGKNFGCAEKCSELLLTVTEKILKLKQEIKNIEEVELQNWRLEVQNKNMPPLGDMLFCVSA